MTMFPTPKSFSRPAALFLREAAWVPFVDSSLALSEKNEIVRRLILGESTDIPKYYRKHITDISEAESFVASHRKLKESVQKVYRHTVRGNYPALRGYLKLIEAVYTKHYQQEPCSALYSSLYEHGYRNCSQIFEAIQEGTYEDKATVLFQEELEESLREYVKGDSVAGYLREATDEQMASHRKFVTGFSKTFGISVEKWESVAEGIILYLDQEAHNKVCEKLVDSQQISELVTTNHGYILLRRGQQSDIDFGMFSQPWSKWMFVASPKAEQVSGGISIISKSEYKPIKLADV